MGRAGIEPATLGLKVDATGFACSRVSLQGGMVEPNRLTCHRVLLGQPVDLALTPPSSTQATLGADSSCRMSTGLALCEGTTSGLILGRTPRLARVVEKMILRPKAAHLPVASHPDS